MEFGNLHQIEIREIWANEATKFTPWLAENIQLLGDELGLELELREREASVGDFSCDIHAFDLTRNREVVIENQLESTDHSHLGQLLTYAAGLEACVVVWIAKEIRDEHRAALDWLNRKTPPGLDFFAVVPEVFKIDESKPSIKLKLVVVPNEWRKEISSSELEDPSSRASMYKRFFQDIIDEARKNGFKGAKKALPQNWVRFSTPKSCIGIYVAFKRNNKISVEIYIESPSKDMNKNIYDELLKSSDEINKITNNNLTWERLDGNKGSRVAYYFDGSIEGQPEDQDLLKIKTIEKLVEMREKLLTYIIAAAEKVEQTLV